jgi:hypothetical protein
MTGHVHGFNTNTSIKSGGAKFMGSHLRSCYIINKQSYISYLVTVLYDKYEDTKGMIRSR